MRDQLRQNHSGGPLYERVELSEHYLQSKDSFVTGVSFCSECNNPKCLVNKSMCLQILQTFDLVETLAGLDNDKRISLTVRDFYRKDELEHFLEYFTRPVQEITDPKCKLRWSSKQFDFPRVAIATLDTRNAISRWDTKERTVYNENAWRGKMRRSHLDSRHAGLDILPDNFESLLHEIDPTGDESIISINDTMESLIGHTRFTKESFLICLTEHFMRGTWQICFIL